MAGESDERRWFSFCHEKDGDNVGEAFSSNVTRAMKEKKEDRKFWSKKSSAVLLTLKLSALRQLPISRTSSTSLVQ